jgi:hypothetical protein
MKHYVFYISDCLIVTKTPQHLVFLFSLGIRSERQKLATELGKTSLIPTSHKPEQEKQLIFYK